METRLMRSAGVVLVTLIVALVGEASPLRTSAQSGAATAAPRSTAASAAVPAADVVVSQALAKASSQNKTVLIEFGASWCVWCKRFQTYVSAPEVRDIIQAHYVIVNLTVDEDTPEQKLLENAGGEAAKIKWGGEKSGLPFYVFLDGRGRKIADSNAMPDGTNIGFPGNPKEASAFMALIDKTAARLVAADRARLSDFLTESLPK